MFPSLTVIAARSCRYPFIKYTSVCFVVLSLLAFLPLPSKAGQWVITYSNTGTQAYDIIRPPSSVTHYSTNNTPSSGSAGVSSGSGKIDFNVKASIVATLTWQPAYGQTMTSDPPPTAPVSIMETGSASEGPGPWGGSGSAPIPAGTASDGLGDPPTVSSNGQGYFSSGAHLFQKDGSSGVITLDPAVMSAVCPTTSFVNGPPNWEGNSGANVSLTVQVSSVTATITPSGAVTDSSGNYNILVGQSCTPSLSVLPSNYTVSPSSYQWSVSGTTLQSWTVSADQTTTTEVDGPGILTNPTAHWFWNDNLGSGHSTVETITCTATVTPPSGQGASFSATASRSVIVWVPTWSESGTGDGMYVVNRTPTSSPDFWVEAGPTPGGNDEGGMNWMGSVHSPLPATFSDGTLTMAQLVIPGNSIVAQGNHYHVSNNGQEGLDTSYPYPNENTGNIFASHDSPGIDLTNTVAGCAAYSAVTQDQFEDYVLFTPPGSSQCVPLGQFVWTIDGNVTEPYQNNIYDWAYFGSSSAGSMNPSGTRSFVQTNSFPSWTQNSGNNSYSWVGG